MVVTGMPWAIVRSSGGTWEEWKAMPLRIRRPATVTSMAWPLLSRIRQRDAAERWLRTASGPPARTAAIQRPWRVMALWPGA